QALVLVGYPESGAVIVREALEHGYFSRFVLSDGLAVPAFIQAFAGALEGAAGATPYSLQWPNYTETLRLYEERYGPVGHVPLLSEMFESVTTLALAAEMAGDTASAAVRDALESINKSLSGDEEIVWPHEWAKAVQLIREGIPFFYAGVLDPEGFNEAGDPGVVLAGAWTVIGGRIREIGAREYFLDAQPEAQDPVKIGVLIPYSGELADYGQPLQRAAVLAASHVNEQGGLLGGRRLELVFADNATDPEAGAAEAARLVAEEGVAAVISLPSGVTIRAATEVTIPNQVVHVTLGTAPSISELDDDGYVFRIVPSDAHQARVLARVVRRFGYSRVAVLYVNNEYGNDFAQRFTEAFAEFEGEVAASAAFEPGRASYHDQLAALSESGAQALVLVAYVDSGVTIVREALDHGHFERFFFSDSLHVPEFFQAFGTALDGSWGTSSSSALRPGVSDIRGRYAAKYGRVEQPALLYDMYDAVFVTALAMELAGETSGSALRDALQRINKDDEGEDNPVQPGEWDKALEMIRDGKPFHYMSNPRAPGFDEAGDLAVSTVGVWTVRDGRILDFATQTVARAPGE
ncbi:MAG TPA: ABC transporter substrate-binding protein, partial [Limnochordales bacterium]